MIQTNVLLKELKKNLILLRYPLEQIIADKFYTALVYGKEVGTESRMKDLYDFHILSKSYEMLDYLKVTEAIKKTMDQKNNQISVEEYEQIIRFLQSSDQQQMTWKNYQRLYPFARGIDFDDVMNSLNSVALKLKT